MFSSFWKLPRVTEGKVFIALIANFLKDSSWNNNNFMKNMKKHKKLYVKTSGIETDCKDCESVCTEYKFKGKKAWEDENFFAPSHFLWKKTSLHYLFIYTVIVNSLCISKEREWIKSVEKVYEKKSGKIKMLGSFHVRGNFIYRNVAKMKSDFLLSFLVYEINF